MKRKVCVVITARPSYSRIKTALQAIKDHPQLELQLVLAASALLDRYGNTARFIEEDGFEIAARVYMVLEGENLTTMAKTTGLGLMELATVFDNLKPDVVVTSMWGGMYVAFYKQALRHGLFNRARLAGNINFGVVPEAIGKDHPEGALAGVHSNYHFTYPPGNRSAINKRFVERYVQRWNEYPSYAAEAAYTGLYLFKTAVEKANRSTVTGKAER